MTKPPFEPESSPSSDLGFDEFIGIFVAFLTVGGILFWSFTHQEAGGNFNEVLPLNTTAPSVPITPPSPLLTLPLDTGAKYSGQSAR